MLCNVSLLNGKRIYPQVDPKINAQSSNCNFRLSQNATFDSSGLEALGLQNRALVSFKGKSDDKFSYNAFESARLKSGIFNVADLEENICRENLLGAGLNSEVYSFNDKSLDNWVLKVDKKPFYFPQPNDEFIEVPDDFEGVNMGQVVAVIGDRYKILKKIKGTSHSFDDWSARINGAVEVTRMDSLDIANAISKIADFDQKVFDDYAYQLKILGEHGFKQDSINPNNLLIDFNAGKINIIDFFGVADPSHINSRLDLICPVLDFAMFSYIYDNLNEEEQQKLLESSRTIIKKCNLASQKYALPQDEATYIDYLTNVDKWFGCFLVDKGGDYRTRYFRMKELLPEVTDCL